MPDDRKNEPVQSDFDDWLADEDAAPTDPTTPVDGSESGVDDGDTADHVAVFDATASPDAQDVNPDPTDDDGDAPTSDTPVNPFAPPPPPPEPEPDESTDEILVEQDEEESATEPAQDDEDLAAELVEPEAQDGEGDEDAADDEVDEVDEDVEVSDTGEIPVDDQPVVEFEAFDGGHERITGEMEIIAPTVEEQESEVDDPGSPSAQDDASTADVGPIIVGFGEEADVEEDLDPPFDFGEAAPDDKFDPFDDTGEAVFVTGETPIIGAGAAAGGVVGGSLAGASFAELWGVADVTQQPDEDGPGEGWTASEPEDDEDPEDEFESDTFDLGTDDFQRGQTREHVGLAEAIAAAETEETEKVALVAAIPGLEPSVVGFEDVVEAEGYRKVRARGAGDLVARVTTALVLVAALVASLFWRPALLLLAMAVFVLGAGEFYTALVRHDRKPIAFFGFIGIIAACLGAYAWSAAAIPMAFVIAAILLLLFYAVTPGRPDPMGNLALTTTVMVWAGLGSFAMLIAKSDDYVVLILGVVVTVAATDIAAFFVGRSIGRTHFAPWVSPSKTVEGLVAGVIVAFGIGAVLHFFPPFELTSGIAIGAAAAILTPLGDLAMSAAKRMLGLKDMGSVLPGHGGFLDRIDGLLFVVPAAWAILVWAGLL